MKINSITTNLYSSKGISFSHTAVPYPEYEQYQKQNQVSSVTRFVDKLSSLFTPEVTKKSQEIKKDINEFYNKTQQNPEFKGTPKDHLLSVLA